MNDTIAAIATPPGEGGVAIIRISGPQAIRIGEIIFSGPVSSYSSHTLHFGQILDGEKKLDDVLLAVMRAPRSYTGEETIEIHCHGGILLTRQILDLVLCKGARAARPGEFTLRAFLNGKLDLAQAEAVQSLIGAKNTLSLEAAGMQLSGQLSHTIQSFQKELIDIAATLEAWVDFPEEDLTFSTKEQLQSAVQTVLMKMERLLASFEDGKKMQEGVKVCLVGAPNSGKSSLMNALLGQDRAIVTPVAGTTRDLLDAQLFLGGFHLQLLDTAGIRNTEEIVEKEGIRRTKEAMKEADLLLLVLDVSRGLDLEEHELLNTSHPQKTLVVWNKLDLCQDIPKLEGFDSIAVSAKTGEGIIQLKEKIETFLRSDKISSKEEVVLTHLRHRESLQLAIQDLKTLYKGLSLNISPEFLSSDLRSCLEHLGHILGLDISEEILGAIFSKFCVGK